MSLTLFCYLNLSAVEFFAHMRKFLSFSEVSKTFCPMYLIRLFANVPNFGILKPKLEQFDSTYFKL